MSRSQTIAPGPVSWPHEDFVRNVLRHTLPYAASLGLSDPDDPEQVREFAHGFMACARTRVGDEDNWDPRFVEQFVQDGLVDVVREVLWARCGFPHVVFDDPKLVAQYAFTRPNSCLVEPLSLPWPTFTIDFARGDLPMEGTYVHRVSVMSTRPPLWTGFGVQVHFASGLDSATYYRSLVEDDSDLMACAPYPPYTPEEYQGSAAQARLVATVRRIVANVALALTNQGNYEHRLRVLGRKGSYERRMSQLPQTKQYILGRGLKVNLDLRREMHEYVEHGHSLKRGPITVQMLVAGHGKWQVCGPGRVGRKWIFVQPYWRGPEDAPILVRPHKLADRLATPPVRSAEAGVEAGEGKSSQENGRSAMNNVISLSARKNTSRLSDEEETFLFNVAAGAWRELRKEKTWTQYKEEPGGFVILPHGDSEYEIQLSDSQGDIAYFVTVGGVEGELKFVAREARD
jgi:hypothetical protein